MDDPTKLDYSACPYCPMIPLTPFSNTPQEGDAKGELHVECFHSHCQECDDLGHTHQEDLGVSLCAWCKHLRNYHMLKCILPKKRLLGHVGINPLREESKSRDFCHYLIQCCADWFPESNRNAAFWEDGELELAPTYIRAGSPGNVRSEKCLVNDKVS